MQGRKIIHTEGRQRKSGSVHICERDRSCGLGQEFGPREDIISEIVVKHPFV